MTKLLQVDFKFQGPFGEELANMLMDLAKSINNEPGMIWKIWTESPESQLGGGVYLFENEETAKNYLNMHSARLTKMGITDIRGVIFDVNGPLSKINKGPVK